MAENVVPRRQYMKEFKVEAVRLAESVGQHDLPALVVVWLLG